jgi:hypothetical protein
MVRPDTPLAPTPEPKKDSIKSVLISKERQKGNNQYSAKHKQTIELKKSDGSSVSSITKQKEKESGKIKSKEYNLVTNPDGNSKLQIDVKTNRGRSSTRFIEDSDKAKSKFARASRRN